MNEAKSFRPRASYGDGPFARYAERLFDAGFTPLPLKGKAAFLPKWNTADFTENTIWSLVRQHPRANVGIRTGKVVGIDIDDSIPSLLMTVKRWSFPHWEKLRM